MPPDALEEIATLITRVGECYQRARRYRAIAATCEERYLEDALAVGAFVRRAARTGALDHGTADTALGSLRDLVRGCEAAIAGVLASEAYRSAARAWDAGRYAEVAALAPVVFAAVESFQPRGAFFYAVPVTRRRGGAEHFTPPADCAEAIAALAREGLPAPTTPPDLGADEHLRAVLLSDDVDPDESPVTLAVDAAALRVPVCRVTPAGGCLVYGPRLAVPFRARLAETVADEWWATEARGYAAYAERLRRELEARGIAIERST